MDRLSIDRDTEMVKREDENVVFLHDKGFTFSIMLTKEKAKEIIEFLTKFVGE